MSRRLYPLVIPLNGEAKRSFWRLKYYRDGSLQIVVAYFWTRPNATYEFVVNHVPGGVSSLNAHDDAGAFVCSVECLPGDELRIADPCSLLALVRTRERVTA